LIASTPHTIRGVISKKGKTSLLTIAPRCELQVPFLNPPSSSRSFMVFLMQGTKGFLIIL
jgi:hypothetical protein